MYVDGILKNTITYTINNQASQVTIGAGAVPAGAQTFKGIIDQPRVQSRAWSAKEVMDYAMNPWQVYLDD